MKKQLLSLTALFLLLACTSSYAQKTLKLDSRVLQDWDESYFYYNEDGQVDSMFLYIQGYEEIKTYKTFTYNEQKLCTVQDDYQFVNTDYIHVSHIEYTYNDKGQLTKRLNFNSYDGVNLNPGGRMLWTYNEDGTIKKIETSLPSWDVEGEWNLFAIENYTYNANKTVKSVEIQSVPFDGTIDNMYVSSIVDYTYNADNKLICDVHKYYYEGGGNMPEATTKNTYEYDENGNMTVYSAYPTMDSTMPQLKYVYHYDLDTKADQVIYPFNFEENQLAAYLVAAAASTNRIVYDEWWQENEETMEGLVHIDDYEWNYSDYSDTGIRNIGFDSENTSFYIYDNTLYFVGLREGTKVEIYDISGAKVSDQSYGAEGISLDVLSRGGYIAKVAGQRMPVKFVR